MAEQEEKKMIGDGESETKEVGSLESLSEPKLEQQHDSLQFSTNMILESREDDNEDGNKDGEDRGGERESNEKLTKPSRSRFCSGSLESDVRSLHSDRYRFKRICGVAGRPAASSSWYDGTFALEPSPTYKMDKESVEEEQDGDGDGDGDEKGNERLSPAMNPFKRKFTEPPRPKMSPPDEETKKKENVFKRLRNSSFIFSKSKQSFEHKMNK